MTLAIFLLLSRVFSWNPVFSRKPCGFAERVPSARPQEDASRRACLRLWMLLLMLAPAAPMARAADVIDSTGWTSDLEQALQGAAEREQLVLVYLSSDRCKYCTQMVQTTLAEPALRRAIDTTFVPVAINASARPDLVRRLKVRAFPTIVVLDARGRAVKQVVGFQTSAKLWQQVGPHARMAHGAAPATAAEVATQSPAPVVNAADLRTAELRKAPQRKADGADEEQGGDRLPR
jgi:thioredoxin-like negative regulator of GroEL